MKLFARQIAVGAGTLVFATVVACTGSVEGSTPPTISPDIFAPIPTPRPFGLTPTPTATPFIVPVPTVTTFPTVEVSATAAPTATPSATIGAPGPEPTAVPTATSVPTVEPTPAQEPTATPVPEPTATPAPTATPTPVPIPVAPGNLMFSLEEGAITLDPDNHSPEVMSSGANVANFSVKATFDNPINGTFRDFSYGVKFRELDGLYQAVSINSAGDLRHLEGRVGDEGQPDSFTILHIFDYDDIATGGSETNSLHLTVVEDEAWLFVNDTFIGRFAVGGNGASSDVQFIAELDNETQISGALTQLTGIEVRSSASAAFLPSLTMVKEAGVITRSNPTGTTSSFLVEAEFVSGYERVLGQWTVGFEFSEPINDVTHWVFINNSKQWKHFRQSGPGAQLEEFAGGIHNGILRDRGDVNKLEMLGQNGIQQLFINGVFVSSVSIQPEPIPVQISAFSGFADTDQLPGFPTEMLNYNAWSFGN